MDSIPSDPSGAGFCLSILGEEAALRKPGRKGTILVGAAGLETLTTSPPLAVRPRRSSRGRVIAFLSAAAAVFVLAAAAWMQWYVAVEEWYLYRWRHGDASEKESSLRTLVEVGSVRALGCLEAERILYLV